MLMAEFTTPARTYGSCFTASIFVAVCQRNAAHVGGHLAVGRIRLGDAVIFMSCAAS